MIFGLIGNLINANWKLVTTLHFDLINSLQSAHNSNVPTLLNLFCSLIKLLKKFVQIAIRIICFMDSRLKQGISDTTPHRCVQSSKYKVSFYYKSQTNCCNGIKVPGFCFNRSIDKYTNAVLSISLLAFSLSISLGENLGKLFCTSNFRSGLSSG